MRVFVTGATGVVGRRVLPALVYAGHQVTAAARTAERGDRLRALGATPVVVDLFDAAAVRRAVAGHDVVINLATRVPGSTRMMLPGGWRANDRLRRNASRTLVDAAIEGGAQRFIQESIALAYADAADRWIGEDDAIEPPPHVRSALDAEANVRRFESHGTAVILRFALFYGPDSSHTLDAVALVWKGVAPTFGSPDGYVSSISTDDAAGAVVAALGVPSGTYNAGDDEPLTKREYFASLARALGVPTPRFFPSAFQYLAGSVGRAVARSLRVSNRKLVQASGWRPRWRSAADAWPEVVRGVAATAREKAQA